MSASRVTVPEEVRLDPYWLWAEATGYSSLGGPPADHVPVLLELAVTVGDAVRMPRTGGLPQGLELGALYHEPAQGLGGARFCTGHATPAFLRAVAQGHHAKLVRRFEIGLPVVALKDRRPEQKQSAMPGLVQEVFPPVLAVIDDALPVAHPALIDASGAPRCLALWDQEGASTPGAVPDYGRVTTGRDIAQALAGRRPPSGLPTDTGRVHDALGLTRLRRSWTHGSAVLGVAALGLARPPGPVPPFIGVSLPRRTTDDTSGLSLAVHVLDALHFVLRRAEDAAQAARKLPGAVVVNLSFGRFAGAHDGSGMLSAAIDELIALRNAEGLPLAVVLPAGNGHLSRGHARGELAPGASHALAWRIQPDDRTPSFVELRPDITAGAEGAAPDARATGLAVTLRSPAGVECGPVAVDEQAVMRDAEGRAIATVTHLSRSAAGDGPMVLVAVAPTFSLGSAAPTAPSGRWSIRLDNGGALPLRIAAWIQRDDRFAGASLGGRPSYFEDDAYRRFDVRGRPLDTDPPGSTAWVSRTDTINPIATGRYPVVVGARDAATGRASPYSAAGAGRPPQLTAVADESRARPGIATRGTHAGSRVRANGTSLAAPQVARWLLERAPAPAAPGATRIEATWAREVVAKGLGAARSVAPQPAPASARGGAAALPSPTPWP
jgi:hypothetical protein